MKAKKFLLKNEWTCVEDRWKGRGGSISMINGNKIEGLEATPLFVHHEGGCDVNGCFRYEEGKCFIINITEFSERVNLEMEDYLDFTEKNARSR